MDIKQALVLDAMEKAQSKYANAASLNLLKLLGKAAVPAAAAGAAGLYLKNQFNDINDIISGATNKARSDKPRR